MTMSLGEVNKLISIFYVSAFFLVGCSSQKPMNDTTTYASMNCTQLKQEQQAVSENAKNSRESGSFGFLDVLGAVSEGIALGSGQAALAQQQHDSNAQYNDYRDGKTAEADAYDKRTELLNKVIVLRKCG